jgi:hypothetical protein
LVALAPDVIFASRSSSMGALREATRTVPSRQSILETLMRDMQGTAMQKLALFERLRAAGTFVNEPATGVAEAEKALRMLAAMEKGGG